jgi:hypothetical protein
MLDVAVSERSLSDARNKVEDEMGRSVRASVDPDVAGRNGGTGRRSIRDIYETQTELLVQIRDAIEEGSFANSGGGGTTILGGLGLGGAVGTAGAVGGAIGLGGLIQNQFGEFSITELMEQQLSPEMSIANAFTGGGAGAAMGLGNILLEQSGDIGEMLGLVDDAEAFEQSLIDGGMQLRETIIEGSRTGVAFWTEDVPQAIAERPEWVSSLLTFTFNRPQWLSSLLQHTLERPQWLTDLTGFRLTEPEWLSNLSNFRLSEPKWVSQLTSVLGGAGNGRGSGPPQAGARIPGSEINANVSVDGSGLQRDFERALSRALRTRDLESFIIDTISDEFGLR